MRPPDSLWWSTLDQPVTPRAPLREHLDVDVAIVGGGFTGLWTARELKRRDPSLRVAVLEKSVCGFGASGRNGGWASALYPLGDDAVIARHGRASLDHLRVALQGAVRSLGASLSDDGIDAHFVQGGSLTFARSDVQAQRLREEVAVKRDHGYGPDDVTWLDNGAARERGAVSDALGATYTPHCARLHPARLVQGLARVDEQLGVSLFENSTVLRIVGGRDGTLAEVVTAHASVHARFVVRATEGFTSTLPGERRSVAPIYSLMIATEPQPTAFWDEVGFRHYETFADDRHLIIYGQRTNDDRIAFGGRGAPYHFASTVEERFDESPKVFSLLESTLRELFPSLTGDVTHRWGGPLAMPRDRSPSVLVDYASGLASAGGYTGDGVVMSYVAANALADLISTPDVDTAFTVLPFVQHRSKRWEVEPLRWLGINAGLGLAAWADHVERRTNRESRASGWLDRLLD
ncbi:MAG TPA: FAD-dependent oxidoreductase [Acidimicrobiales bacterium]|nr:FAD-dependent oxidoreductase [Acidimicrobiales bacterium]